MGTVIKRHLLTLFICSSTLFLGYFISNIIRISFFKQTEAIPMSEEMSFFSKSVNSPEIDMLILFIEVVAFVIAGYIAATRVKQWGFIGGASIGVLCALLSTGIVILYYLNGINLAEQVGSPEFIQVNFTADKLSAYIATIPSAIIKAVILCGIGGGIYDIVRIAKTRKKQQKPQFRPKTYDELFKNSY